VLEIEAVEFLVKDFYSCSKFSRHLSRQGFSFVSDK
jgi:hypothetical protein